MVSFSCKLLIYNRLFAVFRAALLALGLKEC
jgi:hypothetical protein